MFCPQCGAPNENDAVFCGNCGAVLNPDEMPNAPGQVPGDEERAPDDWPAALPPPPPSPPPPPAYPVAPSAPTSGLALASLLLGIGGLTILPLLGSILALIFGYMARKEIRQRPDQVSGDGLAVAGIVMGWIAVGLAVVGLLVGAGFMVCGVCGAIGAGN